MTADQAIELLKAKAAAGPSTRKRGFRGKKTSTTKKTVGKRKKA
jgi:hypothetical protein